MICLVNFMDDGKIDESKEVDSELNNLKFKSESRFSEIRDRMSKFFSTVGYKPENIPFIPVSGYYGMNITRKTDKLAWYEGPTLLEAMEKLREPVAYKKLIDKPARMCCFGLLRLSGFRTIAIGKVV